MADSASCSVLPRFLGQPGHLFGGVATAMLTGPGKGVGKVFLKKMLAAVDTPQTHAHYHNETFIGESYSEMITSNLKTFGQPPGQEEIRG